jgi:hypothetical protein
LRVDGTDVHAVDQCVDLILIEDFLFVHRAALIA